MPRKYFPFYFTFREAGKTMPPRLRATFYEAIIDYATTGVDPVLPPSISGCWAVVKPLLDTSQKRYNAGVNGGRPSKNDSFGFPDSETNGLHKEKEKEKDNEKDTGKENHQRPTAPPAACAPQKGAGGGMAALNSSLDNGDRDAATDEARRIFFGKMQQRTAWPAAEAAPPDAEKEEG